MLILRRLAPIVAAVLFSLALPPVRADESRTGRATIAFAGDILFDRGVAEAIKSSGPDALFAGVAPTLAHADLAVANLECPLSRRGLRAAKPFSFRADPDLARSLSRAGLDAVSLANNHSLDYGRGALTDTIDAVHAAGVKPIGAGATRAEALEPATFELNGLRVAILAYCDLFVEGSTPRADAPGIATGDRDALVAAVRSARAANDVVVVFLHWGVEYRPAPTEDQRALAKTLFDAGASAVVGAHPHVLQPIERDGPRVVAYSLGNFVFDQSRRDGSDSAILVLTLTSAGVESVDAVPVVIDACKPSIATGEDASRIARRLAPV